MITSQPEKHPTVSAVLRALPLRNAVHLHVSLKSGGPITPTVREMVRTAVRRAGQVPKHA